MPFRNDRDQSASHTNGGRDGASKLAAFLSSNKAESHIPTFGVEEGEGGGGGEGDGDCEDGGGGGGEGQCKVDGCSNRAVHKVGVCPVHTKRCDDSLV